MKEEACPSLSEEEKLIMPEGRLKWLMPFTFQPSLKLQ